MAGWRDAAPRNFWLVWVVGSLLLGAIGDAPVRSAPPVWVSSAPAPREQSGPVNPSTMPMMPTPRVPFEALTPQARQAVRWVLDRPTLSVTAPSESFSCKPEMYVWLLDHPRETAALWRGLGATVTDIENRGPQRFGWKDDQGNELWWETIYRGGELRVWYAEGRGKPSVLLPNVSVQAVVLLQHGWTEIDNRPVLRHQATLAIRTDSRALTLASRIMGASAPRLAEQHLGQLQTYFSGMAWHLGQDPVRAARLFRVAGIAGMVP